MWSEWQNKTTIASNWYPNRDRGPEKSRCPALTVPAEVSLYKTVYRLPASIPASWQVQVGVAPAPGIAPVLQITEISCLGKKGSCGGWALWHYILQRPLSSTSSTSPGSTPNLQEFPSSLLATLIVHQLCVHQLFTVRCQHYVHAATKLHYIAWVFIAIVTVVKY